MLMQAHGCGAQASVRFKMFLNLQRLDEQRARIKREAAVRRGLAGPVEADKNTVCLAAFDVLDVNRLPAPRTDALQRWWVGYHLLRPLRWRLSAALRFGVCFFAPILGLPLIARIAVDRESAFLGHRPAIGWWILDVCSCMNSSSVRGPKKKYARACLLPPLLSRKNAPEKEQAVSPLPQSPATNRASPRSRLSVIS